MNSIPLTLTAKTKQRCLKPNIAQNSTDIKYRRYTYILYNPLDLPLSSDFVTLVTIQ